MTVKELNRNQLEGLKQNYLSQTKEGDVSYGELIDADNLVPDEVVFEYYAGVTFVEEDFFCGVSE